MIPRFKSVAGLSFVLIVGALPSHAQRQLQDSFWLQNKWTNSITLSDQTGGYRIAVDRSNRCYAALGSLVAVYDGNGGLISNLVIASARGVAYDSISNLVFVSAVTNANQIRVYDSNLQLIRQWGTNAIGSALGISIGPDGLVYIADSSNSVIHVYTRNGSFVRKWGQAGSAGGEFSGLYDLSVGSDGTVYAVDYNNVRLQRFDATGNFIQQFVNSDNTWNPRLIGVSPDGLVCAGDSGTGPKARLMTSDLTTITNSFPHGSTFLMGVTFSPSGQRMYILTDKEVRVFQRGYRTMGLLMPNALPLPVVYAVTQRPGTSLVDVDFSVVDSDNATVSAAAIAAVEGRKDLRGAVKMVTFEEGTGAMLGTNVTTGERRRITWNAGTDWPTNFANVRINILAKDNRALLDFHYLTIPSNATYGTELKISRSPLSHDDFLGVWTWMIATGNSDVVLQTGDVFGVSGVYSNVLLAQTQAGGGVTSTVTTTAGRSFLFDLLNVREASSAEVYRAKVATTPGAVTRWDPRKKIGDLPVKVNEYGFDTGLLSSNPNLTVTNAWWVVPLP